MSSSLYTFFNEGVQYLYDRNISALFCIYDSGWYHCFYCCCWQTCVFPWYESPLYVSTRHYSSLDIFVFLQLEKHMRHQNFYLFYLLVRPDWCLGLDMFRRQTCLISNFTDSLALFTHSFRPAFSEICFIIVNTTIDCSSTAWLKNMCESGFNVPWFSICAIAVSYF